MASRVVLSLVAPCRPGAAPGSVRRPTVTTGCRAVASLVLAGSIVASAGAQGPPAPVPRPFPGAGSAPASPPRQADPPAEAPAPQPEPATPARQTPRSAQLPAADSAAAAQASPVPAAALNRTAPDLGDVPIYPTAAFLESFDAGQGQQYHLYGTNQGYQEIVAYYRNVLDTGGREIYSAPAMRQFDLGRYDDERMAYPPSIVVKDYAWNGSPGYLHVAGTAETRYRTIIQVVPPAPVATR